MNPIRSKNPEVESAPKVRVLLVEDHPMFRDQLAELVNGQPDMTVCGQADNSRDGLALAVSETPDLAIVDMTLKDTSGLDFIKDIRAQGLGTLVLVLSMHEESLYAERTLQAGAKGYISKSRSAAEVMTAIRYVLSGQVYLSPEMTASILKRMTDIGRTAKEIGPQALTDRELEIFQWIGRGKKTVEIARLMKLGQSTVDTYRTRMRAKLGVKSAAELYSVAATWVRDEGKRKQ